MIRTVNAVFDGEVFRLDEPLDLPPNTKVKVTIEIAEPESEKTASFLDTAASLNLEALRIGRSDLIIEGSLARLAQTF